MQLVAGPIVLTPMLALVLSTFLALRSCVLAVASDLGQLPTAVQCNGDAVVPIRKDYSLIGCQSSTGYSVTLGLAAARICQP